MTTFLKVATYHVYDDNGVIGTIYVDANPEPGQEFYATNSIDSNHFHTVAEAEQFLADHAARPETEA